MSRTVKLVSTVAVIGLLAACGGGAPAVTDTTATAARSDALRVEARARATQRVLNSLRVRGHHNVRRPRHLSAG